MILYVNGDSHSAGAEAVVPHAFAEDDPEFFYLGRTPHPENLAVTWGKQLSLTLRAGLRCDAESASSNTRIIRTTREWLNGAGHDHPEQLVIIQWSTWEREEWLHDGVYYQVGASGIDDVPQALQEKYRNFVVSTDWQQKTHDAHGAIWAFHQELQQQGIRHIFFNGNNDFSLITDQHDWGTNYIGPYDPKMTYDAIIRAAGIDTVAPNSWHFGRNGHSHFHRYMLNYIMSNGFI
jgi:hypothetical protein